MQLSTKARYAARALVELAKSSGQGPVKLRDIAANQNISLKYLEQVMFPLRAGGYVRTQKGSQGGYLLVKAPEKITLLEIVQCVEGSVTPVSCADDPDLCDRSEVCAVRDAWVGLKDAIHNELGKITLADLAEKQKALDVF